jgi:hypothetical protein
MELHLLLAVIVKRKINDPKSDRHALDWTRKMYRIHRLTAELL